MTGIIIIYDPVASWTYNTHILIKQVFHFYWIFSLHHAWESWARKIAFNNLVRNTCWVFAKIHKIGTRSSHTHTQTSPPATRQRKFVSFSRKLNANKLNDSNHKVWCFYLILFSAQRSAHCKTLRVIVMLSPINYIKMLMIHNLKLIIPSQKLLGCDDVRCLAMPYCVCCDMMWCAVFHPFIAVEINLQ